MAEAAIAQLRAVLSGVSESRARQLIDACTGNVDQAVELYFAQGGGDQCNGDATTDEGAKATLRPTAASASASASASALDDNDDEVVLSERPAGASTSASAAGATKKRKGIGSSAGATASSSAASPAKRQAKAKTSTPIKDANQHSLASFFNRSPVTPLPPSAAAASAPTALPLNGSTKLTASDRARAHRLLVVSPLPSSTPAYSAASAAASAAPAAPAAAASPIAPLAAAAAAASPSSSPDVASSPSFLSSASGAAAAASSSSCDPLHPCWQPGEPVPFVFLSRLWKLIEGENGRIKITNWLTYAFWQILAYTPADLPAALFLSSDQLAPSYLNHQLGVGGSTLVRLVCEITSVSHARISADHARLGDLGLIAAQYRLTQTLLFRPKPLSLAHVFSTFHALGDVSKRERKEAMLKKLFSAAREDELVYLIRISEGSLRIGAVITTVLSALAKAFVLHHLYSEGVAEDRRWEVCSFARVLQATETVRATKGETGSFVLEALPADTTLTPASRSASISRRLPSYLARATAKLRRAYAELPSFHEILPVLLASSTNIFELHRHIRLTAGVPVKPQLGRPLTSVAQVLRLFRGIPFSVECKYDGLRAQIHRLESGAYRIFSRHLMDQGDRWADLEPLIEAAIRCTNNTRSFILDAEIVAVQHMPQADNGAAASATPVAAEAEGGSTGSAGASSPSFRILPFQQLATRRRKGESSSGPLGGGAEKRVEVSCMVYAFDFLSLNGESLLLRPLPERRRLMTTTFAERCGEFQFVEHCDISAESASAIAIEELDEEEHNEAEEGKSRAKSKAKGTTKAADTQAKQTSLKGAIAAAAVTADAADQRGSDDEADADSDVEEVDGPSADGDDQPTPPQTAADATTDDSATAAAASSSSLLSPSASADGSAAAAAAAPSASELIASFLRTVAIPRGEGIMAKSLSAHSTYEPDVRTDQWAKLKKDYMGGVGVADSIDVVIIGAWRGNGRKAGWLSPFLAAVYNSDTEEFESFAKIMTGFSDAVYRQLTEECMALVVPAPPRYYRVSDSLRPPLWFKPQKVWEIRGADLTISPVHAAARGRVHESRGISLRFPRFIRERDDKIAEQCTTADEIARMYRSQSTVY